MNLIKEKLDKIYEKYGEYLHFDYTKGKNNNNEIVENWNVYMSDIGTNHHKDKTSFLSFLDKLIDEEIDDILKANLLRKEEKLISMEEAIETIKEDIITLKLKTTKEEV